MGHKRNVTIFRPIGYKLVSNGEKPTISVGSALQTLLQIRGRSIGQAAKQPDVPIPLRLHHT